MFTFIEEAKKEGALALASEDADQLKGSAETGIEMTQTLEMVLVDLEDKSNTARHALDHEEAVDRQSEYIQDIQTYERIIDIVEGKPAVS